MTGGEPLGFDVGAKAAGGTLPGLDLVRAAPHCHPEGLSLICKVSGIRWSCSAQAISIQLAVERRLTSSHR